MKRSDLVLMAILFFMTGISVACALFPMVKADDRHNVVGMGTSR
jgi:hypothetical protein